MSITPQSWRSAWEPLTPRGVSAFAGGSLGRLLVVQSIIAFLAAASVVWFLKEAWFPVVQTAIHQLPARGEIHNGQLGWSGESPLQLAENRFLGLAVDLFHSGQLGREAHLQVEFGRENLRVYSLLGYQVIDYPVAWNVAFNQTDLDPWWGAWKPIILVVAGAICVVGLMVSWALLATLYCAPVRIISFLENRDLSWGQSWRLSGAAMMPGALFLTAGIVAYSLNWMDLIRLGGMLGLHFVIGWIYLFISPPFCPRPVTVKNVTANPFATPKDNSSKVAGKPPPTGG